ncbi:glycosyltransferase family 4 protein [Streptomyces silvisoli]|uniref:D-inositol 3-phosphate glycosyltransferase n=1 Tax=Streptomyces silvisoli TaxID=3034235 RepID=A0ABT5ZS69_9ACTN|nr:glycosyltransferase family 4 protein [Streptomyces silvisoli]MDF3292657.1 glycosyltransferase family 4 protein [Streptomyces silvisoli]
MSRIATVSHRCGPGRTCGSETMAVRTAEALTAAGHEVFLVETSADWPATPPDVVHAYDLATPEPVVMAHRYATDTGTPFLLTPASTPQLWPDAAVGAMLCRAADRVFALTDHEAAMLRDRGVEPDRLRLIPQAPDLVGVADPAGFRERHGITGDMALFLGRRIPTKGYDVLRDAATAVWREHPDTTFVVAGPQGDAPPWDHPNVCDLGLVDGQTKHDALAAASVVCLPTSADVFPLVFVEAWACGRPVVSGAFPGAHGVVRDGVDGLIVDPEPTAVAAALIRLFTDSRSRERLGAAGLRRVHTEMTWSRVADVITHAIPRTPEAMFHGTR